jgi:hypothetical protein
MGDRPVLIDDRVTHEVWRGRYGDYRRPPDEVVIRDWIVLWQVEEDTRDER